MERRMKVFEIGTGYTPIPATIGAATEIVVEQLANSMLRQGVDITVVDIAAEERKAHAFPIIEVPIQKFFQRTDVGLGVMHKLKRVAYSVNLARKLIEILKETEEQVVFHFHNQYNAFFFLKLCPLQFRKRCYIAYTNHSYIWFGKWEEIKRTVSTKYFQEIFSMKHADMNYVLNTKAYHHLTEQLRIPSKRVALIDNGVNTSAYYPMSEEDKGQTRQRWSAEGKRVFIHIGSVCDRKNQMEAVRLMMPFLKQFPEYEFWYAGGIIDEAYKEKIDQYVSRHNVSKQVRYLGEIEPGATLNEIYNIADALVFSSKSEAYGLVISEALAAGTPVIIKESLEVPMKNLCLTYADRREFQNQIKTTIENFNSRKKLSEDGRTAIEAKYSWNKISRRYAEIWESDIGNRYKE